MTKEQFWLNVSAPNEDGCMLWERAKFKRGLGYGVANLKSVQQAAHRLAWKHTYGDIPDKMCVLHKCDVPLCCNPKHLFLGTHQDNMRDRDAKGRNACGQRNGMSKLTEAQVFNIHALRKDGVSTKAIAARHGVDRSTINLIVRGKLWKEVYNSLPYNPEEIYSMIIPERSVTKGADCRASKLTEGAVKDIRWLATQRVKYAVLSRRFGVTRMTIHRVVTRKSWKHVK